MDAVIPTSVQRVGAVLSILAAPAVLEVFDAQGRLVRTLSCLRGESDDAGLRFEWDGRDAQGRARGSGVYA